MILRFLLVPIALSCGFVRDRSQTQMSRLLTASSGSSGDKFGSSVSLDWSVGLAIVGADGVTSKTGAAYIFESAYSNGADTAIGYWAQRTQLVGSNSATGDRFGAAVSIRGSVALVGAPMHHGTNVASGSAYFFSRDPTTGAWTQTTTVTAGTDDVTNGFFGTAVDMSPNYAVIGCPRCTANLLDSAGKAYIFSKATGWSSPVATLQAPDAFPTAQFGNAVAMTDDDVVIGAFQDRSRNLPQSNYQFPGAIYVFSRSSLWTDYRKLTAPFTPTLPLGYTDDFFFGMSVSVRQDVMMVMAFNGAIPIHYYYTKGNNEDWVWVKKYDKFSLDYDPAQTAFVGSPIETDGLHGIVGDKTWGGTGAAFLLPHNLIAIGPAAQKITPQSRHTSWWNN